MNDPKAVALLQAAGQANACSARLAPYAAKAAEGTLQMSDIKPEDAIWTLAIVKPKDNRDALKSIAKDSLAKVFVGL